MTLTPESAAIRAGNLLYISGQIGVDLATGQLAQGIEAQLHRAFRHLDDAARAAGLGLEHAVSMTLYVVDVAYFARVNETMARFVKLPFPALSIVGVAALPHGALVEIDAILAAG